MLATDYSVPTAVAPRLQKLYSERDTSLPRAQPGEPGVAEPGSPPRSETDEARPAASETHRPGIGRRRPVAGSVTGPDLRKPGIPMTYTFKLSRRLASNNWRAAAITPLLVLLVACGGGSSTGASGGNEPAVPGWLSVQLTTPNTDDGAVQLRITGPVIQDVMAESAYNGFGSAAAGVADAQHRVDGGKTAVAMAAARGLGRSGVGRLRRRAQRWVPVSRRTRHPARRARPPRGTAR